MHQRGLALRAPDPKPLPDAQKAEVRRSGIQFRILIEEVVNFLLHLMAQLGEPEEDRPAIFRGSGLGKLVTKEGEDLDEEVQEHGRRLWSRNGSGISPPDGSASRHGGTESTRSVARVGKDGAPSQGRRIVFRQAVRVTLPEQDILAAMGHGEERSLHVLQRS